MKKSGVSGTGRTSSPFRVSANADRASKTKQKPVAGAKKKAVAAADVAAADSVLPTSLADAPTLGTAHDKDNAKEI